MNQVVKFFLEFGVSEAAKLTGNPGDVTHNRNMEFFKKHLTANDANTRESVLMENFGIPKLGFAPIRVIRG